MTITTNSTADARHDGGVTNGPDPDPEVPERAQGPRRFSAAYKARILAEYEPLSKADKGALLRREGLYSSLLTSLGAVVDIEDIEDTVVAAVPHLHDYETVSRTPFAEQLERKRAALEPP